MIFAVVASEGIADDLARLAQDSLGGELARRDEGSFLRVQQKLGERAVGRRRRAQFGGVLTVFTDFLHFLSPSAQERMAARMVPSTSLFFLTPAPSLVRHRRAWNKSGPINLD